MDNRSRFAIKYDALKRYAMLNTMTATLPLYVVTEHPKSGGSWISQLLSEALEVPFPRNQAPKLQSSILHGHNLRTPFMKNVVCVFRDGRDIMTSAYFHRLFENDKNSPIMVRKMRAALPFDDYDDVRRNMPAFIEYQANIGRRSLSPGKFSWGQFVDSWIDSSALIVKYEDMLEAPEDQLARLVVGLTGREMDRSRITEIVSKYSFSNQSKRKPGEEDTRSFLRKGQAGDWRDKFTKESMDIFDHYFGEYLLKLGYESDENWVSKYTGGGDSAVLRSYQKAKD